MCWHVWQSGYFWQQEEDMGSSCHVKIIDRKAQIIFPPSSYYYYTINLFRCGAGDSILNIAAFQPRSAQQLWLIQTSSAKVFRDHSHKLCITPVTQHQTMETLSVMTSVSPNSQTKRAELQTPKNTHLNHATDSPRRVHVCASVLVTNTAQLPTGHGGLWWHPWVETHTSYDCAWQMVGQHSLF